MPAKHLVNCAILVFSHIKRQHRQVLGCSRGRDGIENRLIKERPEEELVGFFKIENCGYLFDWGQLANRVRPFASNSAEAFPVLESARYVSRPQPHSVLVRPASRVSRTRSDTAASIGHLQRGG